MNLNNAEWGTRDRLSDVRRMTKAFGDATGISAGRSTSETWLVSLSILPGLFGYGVVGLGCGGRSRLVTFPSASGTGTSSSMLLEFLAVFQEMLLLGAGDPVVVADAVREGVEF